MRASNIARNIAGIPQFQSLKPSQKTAVRVVSIAFAVSIIGLPFAPFIYRGLVAALKFYNSHKENPKMRKVRKERFEDFKKPETEEGKVRTVKKKTETGKRLKPEVEVKGVEAEEVEVQSPEKVLEKRLIEDGFSTGKFPTTGSAPMPAKGVPLQKYALREHANYRLYFATDTGYSSPHLSIYFEDIKINGVEECLQRASALLDFMIKRKEVIENQGFIYTNNPPPREMGQLLKLASDHSDFLIQNGEQVRTFNVVLKYIGDEGEVSYTLRDNDLGLALHTLEKKWETLTSQG